MNLKDAFIETDERRFRRPPDPAEVVMRRSMTMEVTDLAGTEKLGFCIPTDDWTVTLESLDLAGTEERGFHILPKGWAVTTESKDLAGMDDCRFCILRDG